MKRLIKKIFKISVYLFAVIGFSFTGVFVAMKLGFTKTLGVVDSQNAFYKAYDEKVQSVKGTGSSAQPKLPLGAWATSGEWFALREGIKKEKDQINQAAVITNVPARMIVAQIVAEQLRLFTSNRDLFKQVFQPLAVLGTQTQFSMGVTGIKEETARQIEEYLKDPNSQYYLGDAYAHLLDYPPGSSSADRIARFTDYHNHYYSYLYTALFIKEIETAWKRAGYPINTRPEIIATLFNLGFSKSKPNPDPEVGGSTITIMNETYTFGGLAFQFYYSSELEKEFPSIIE